MGAEAGKGKKQRWGKKKVVAKDSPGAESVGEEEAFKISGISLSVQKYVSSFNPAPPHPPRLLSLHTKQ